MQQTGPLPIHPDSTCYVTVSTLFHKSVSGWFNLFHHRFTCASNLVWDWFDPYQQCFSSGNEPLNNSVVAYRSISCTDDKHGWDIPGDTSSEPLWRWLSTPRRVLRSTIDPSTTETHAVATRHQIIQESNKNPLEPWRTSSTHRRITRTASETLHWRRRFLWERFHELAQSIRKLDRAD